MKRDSAGLARDPPPSLAAFKAMDKDSNSLPFPSSVLLTKPLGASAEPVLNVQSTSEEHSPRDVSLPSLTEFIDSYVKPHMAQPFAPSTPRTSPRVPTTPPSAPPHSPSMRATPSYGGSPLMRPSSEDEHLGYSSLHPQMLKQQTQQAYQQQYMQQYQHMREQQLYDHREMQYREQQLQEQQFMRDQHLRDQQLELHEHLREQQQRLMQPYHYEQYANEQMQRRGSLPEPPYKMKRETPSDYQQYPEQKLTVREQLKINLMQREPSADGNYSRSMKGVPPSPTLNSPTGIKHSGGFTQHLFAVPTSPPSAPSLSPTYVPSAPKQVFATTQTPVQTTFDSTKFTNYTSQEFQQLSNKTSAPAPIQSSPPSSILSGSGGKWTAWENEKDVYKQAKLLSESLQSNVKSFLEATSSTPGQSKATSSSTSATATTPSLTIQRASGTSVPPVPLSPSSATSPPTRTSPRGPAPQTSTTAIGKRKASVDANAAPSKVPATAALTPAQQEFQKEALLFSSKDIRSGMHRLNTLLNNANLLDIYNKFQRPDEYSQYHTKSHPLSSAPPASCQ